LISFRKYLTTVQILQLTHAHAGALAYDHEQLRELHRSTHNHQAIIANQKTGTWSLIVLDETGTVACPIASGEKFLILKKEGKML
jgi:hypothetical protein